MLSVTPVFPWYKRTIPTDVRRIAFIVVFVIFSLKNIPIIIATSTGYINRIVQAIPASIYLKASNKVRDEKENNSDNINIGIISSR